MAAEESLKIVIEAEIKDLSAKLKDAQTRLNAVAGSATKLNKAVAGTNTTLVNFGRVIQDAPFGLIGIANNIDPLISSFGQLKRETGSTGAALKTLVSGLAGPAGIAIAISAVTSALVAFGPEIKNFFSGVDAAAQAQKEFNDEIRKAEQSVVANAAGLKSLIAIAADETNSYQVRQNALTELNKTTKQYGETITLAGIQSGEAAKFIDQLTNSLVAQAVAAKLADKAADLQLRQADAIAKIAKSQNELNAANRQVAGLNRTIRQQELGIGEAAVTGRERAQRQLNDATIEYKDITAQLKSVSAQLNAETLKGLDVVKQKSTVEAKAATEKKKANDEELKALQQQRKENEALSKIADVALLRNANPLFPIDVAQAAPEFDNENISKLSQLLTGPAFQEGQKILEGIATQANNTLAAFNLLAPAIDQTFSALANGQNGFDALTQAIKRLIVDLIKAVALAAILSAVTGGAAGVGFGGAKGFNAILGKLLGFRANGGPVGGREPFIVGERGPELFVPNTSGSIVSNTNLRPGNGERLLTRISGNNLLILLDRAKGERGRWG